ncbi:di-trans,poly-cis-decaprenylcistransferase [Elioraea tepida]|jgi:undecaprenyl diphosphate synthase|uniref:Isoprenyl transferase n=1 Tax=Elioraea tepida TaxID=2843330 RepID=A0A975YJH4_9PROT|nr:polyprenyl diphosphate synthase [Elioraea tepida]QXM24654.1 di-trans,poly-cis-decaprenylcistransferase [Elioraea tepida]
MQKPLESLPEPAGVGATPVPRHVAIIMDGNRRWAARQGRPVLFGHRAGAEAARRAVDAAIDFGVRWLTLYAFSSENWRRPQDEVAGLMRLLHQGLERHMDELIARGVRLRVIGDRDRLDDTTRARIEEAEARSIRNERIDVVMALSYGGRDEIARAARKLAEAAQAGRLDPAMIDERAFARALSTAGMPDPDVIVRTSGEQRLSNFLLWQGAYAELVFLDVLWPDFDASWFARVLEAYAGRERRYGARLG